MFSQEQKTAMLLQRIRSMKKFNTFMMYADVVLAVVFLATSNFISSGLMALCGVLAYSTAKRLETQEAEVLKLLEKPERTNKTKVEDLYPSK